MSRESRMLAGILLVVLPTVIFGGVASLTAREPTALLNLAYIGALFLAAAVLTLGVGAKLQISVVAYSSIDPTLFKKPYVQAGSLRLRLRS